ncbi:MAG: hypothetical protein CMN32_07665 [Saprospirales bacterium]|nr:hypothetical protein [Saprospirales bacterium]
MQNRLSFILLSLLFGNTLLLSQNQGQDTLLAKSLGEVVVSALRLPENPFLAPSALSLADSTILKHTSQGLALNEALSALPGVFVQNSENFAQDLRISVRGFGARSAFGIRGVKIFSDGIPESTPDGQSQVDNLDPSSVQSLELLRSSAGSLYGNASGGVLNITTLNFNPGKEASAALTAGSYGFKKYSLSLRNGSAGKLAWHFRASHTRLNGFREHSKMEQWNLNSGLKYDFSNSLSLRLLANYVNSPVAEDPGSITLEQSRADRASAYVNNIEYDAGETVEQGRVAAILKKKFNAGQQLELKSYLTLRDFENKLPFQNGGAVKLDRSHYGFSLGYLVRKSIAGLPFTGYTGAEINVQKDDRQRFNNLNGIRGNTTLSQLEKFNESGLFTTWKVQPADPLSVRVSLRYSAVSIEASDKYLADGDDSGDKEFNRLVPAINASWQLSKEFSLFGGYTTSFETPTLNELSNNPLLTGGFNPELKPQSAETFEFGLRTRNATKKAYGEINIFHIRLENEVVPFELEQFPGRTFYRNSGKSSRSGIELSFASQFSKSLRWLVNYTYNDFKYKDYRPQAKDFSGNRQPGVPMHLLWSSLFYENENGLTGQFQMQYTGSLFADDANTTKINPYLVVNTRIGYRFDLSKTSIHIVGGVNNILDSHYFSNVRINSFGGRYYEPAPGRNWFVRIKFSF